MNRLVIRARIDYSIQVTLSQKCRALATLAIPSDAEGKIFERLFGPEGIPTWKNLPHSGHFPDPGSGRDIYELGQEFFGNTWPEAVTAARAWITEAIQTLNANLHAYQSLEESMPAPETREFTLTI